jgi:predicted phosphodiesterase
MTSDPTSLKVCWQFDPPADAVLAWGLDSAYSAGSISLPAGVSGDISCAVMTGLQTATHYLYRLTSRGAEYISSFTTPPAETATDLIFWGYGDTQSNADIHDAIDASILKEMGDDPSRQTFVFNTGDIMNEASEESLQANQFDSQWVHITGLYSRVPVVNVMGNHDGTKLFIKYFPYPYTSTFDWSFDYGPAHFVVIDLYSGTDPNSPRWQWMRDDLASSTKPWKFILVHEPGWSAGPHENNEVVQKIIHPAAVKYGVAIVFSGHNHYFARAEVDGVTYITTGGGGSELYDPEYNWPDIQKTIKANHYLRVEIKGSLLTVTVLSPQEVQLDQFQLTK